VPHVDAPFVDSPPLQRYGWPIYLPAANPAAGNHFVRTVDGQFLERYVGIAVRLATDANVANREIVVQYRDTDGNVVDQNGINAVVAAGTTADYFFSIFQDGVTATVNSSALVPLHAELLLPTWSMRIFVVNVQAGDQLSRIRLRYEQFYSDSPKPGKDPASW
jgi:hypothetical protein